VSQDQVVAIKAAAALVMLARLPDATPFLPAAVSLFDFIVLSFFTESAMLDCLGA